MLKVILVDIRTIRNSFSTINSAPFNNMHMNGPTEPQTPARSARPGSHGYQQQQMPVENGIDFRHNSHQSTPSSSIRYV